MRRKKSAGSAAAKKPPAVAEPAPASKLPPASPDAEIETTVFRSGNSDAVRLPKSFGLLGKRVKVRREGALVIVEPARKPKWPAGFFESFSDADDDFAAPPRPGHDPAEEERLRRLFDDD
jgi:virulence-associated protein VagC